MAKCNGIRIYNSAVAIIIGGASGIGRALGIGIARFMFWGMRMGLEKMVKRI